MADEYGTGATKGYKKVTPAGQAKQSAPGTERANEGKGSATPWAPPEIHQWQRGGMMADDTGFVKGYEKVTPADTSPHSASGTEKSNQGGGKGPDWARRADK